MFYGVDTRRTFIGHSPGLRKAIDQATAMKFDDESFEGPPANLEYLFTQMLISSLAGWVDFRSEDGRYVEMVYGSIDDAILREAIHAGHVKTFMINRNGYYLANGGGRR